ncbi:hypothetical protein A2U01_0052540, partial [Trifolium medium]|nr:hypothetical protein [Trifolium medium]
ANAHRRDLNLSIGDLVLVRLHPYRQTSVRRHHYHKLSKRYYGPFTIIERIGPVAYKLQLPPESRIHPVFHISALKPFRGTEIPPPCDLPVDSFNNQPLEQPAAVLAHRTVLIQSLPRTQILVQWKGAPADEASWEDLLTFKKCFPSFHLEDKVVS